MGWIMNKTVPVLLGRCYKGRTLMHQGCREQSCVNERNTELPRIKGRPDHLGSARSGRRWPLSWFLWDEYHVGRSRWREGCSKKKEWLVLPSLAREGFQDCSGLSPDTISSAEPCLSHETVGAHLSSLLSSIVPTNHPCQCSHHTGLQ